MPASRPLASQQEILEVAYQENSLLNKLEEVEEELTLYDPNGPWRFFEKRLRQHEARAVVALETGPVEEVTAQRKVLSVIRDLLETPNRLVETRELLVKDMNDE